MKRNMILVIGGAWQGKLAYVQNTLCKAGAEAETGVETKANAEAKSGAEAEANTETLPAPEWEIINAYHLKIKEQMEAGEDPMAAARALLETATEEAGSEKTLVIICDEVGCGVVPMDAFERAWREKVGRVCCYFAEEASQVIRVFCGMGSRIK